MRSRGSLQIHQKTRRADSSCIARQCLLLGRASAGQEVLRCRVRASQAYPYPMPRRWPARILVGACAGASVGLRAQRHVLAWRAVPRAQGARVRMSYPSSESSQELILPISDVVPLAQADPCPSAGLSVAAASVQWLTSKSTHAHERSTCPLTAAAATFSGQSFRPVHFHAHRLQREDDNWPGTASSLDCCPDPRHWLSLYILIQPRRYFGIIS